MPPGGSGYFTCIQNIKLVTNKFKSGGLCEKHVVARPTRDVLSGGNHNHKYNNNHNHNHKHNPITVDPNVGLNMINVLQNPIKLNFFYLLTCQFNSKEPIT